MEKDKGLGIHILFQKKARVANRGPNLVLFKFTHQSMRIYLNTSMSTEFLHKFEHIEFNFSWYILSVLDGLICSCVLQFNSHRIKFYYCPVPDWNLILTGACNFDHKAIISCIDIKPEQGRGQKDSGRNKVLNTL